MNNCKSSSYREKQKLKLSPRLKRTGIKRDKSPRQLVMDLPAIGLPYHNLDDRARFKVYRYSTAPLCMAVATSEDIEQHALCRIDGEVLKVVRVEELGPGVVELKTVKFERYQI